MGTEFKLGTIDFVSGPSPGVPGLTITPTSITLLVGPNNSGKSLALREIEASSNPKSPAGRVVNRVAIDWPSPDDAEELVKAISLAEPARGSNPPGVVVVRSYFRQGRQDSMSINLQQLRSEAGKRNEVYLKQHLFGPHLLRLDARRRFELLQPQECGNLGAPADNHLGHLFRDDAARKRIRDYTREAFGLSFLIDPTSMRRLQPRWSYREVTDQEKRLDQVEFFTSAASLDEVGDGVAASTALIMAVTAFSHRFLLLDEPDALLHPPLARSLGAYLGQLAVDRGSTLIVATHSADFVMGCLQAVPRSTIIRLTHDATKQMATARSLVYWSSES